MKGKAYEIVEEFQGRKTQCTKKMFCRSTGWLSGFVVKVLRNRGLCASDNIVLSSDMLRHFIYYSVLLMVCRILLTVHGWEVLLAGIIAEHFPGIPEINDFFTVYHDGNLDTMSLKVLIFRHSG